MQNARTDLLARNYRPELAVVVYKNSMSDDFYLESHTINKDGQLMAGKPLLQDTIQSVVDVFFDEKKNMASVKGLIPDNLLSFSLLPGGNYKMAWYRPAEIRVMHFAPALKLKTAKVWVPATLYIADRKQLRVHALKANTRPKESAAIFRAPYHNVGSEGAVCLGNANVKKPKDMTYESLMKYWEDLFWLSEFTHFNGEKNVKTDRNKVWSKLINSRTKLKWSDIDELVRHKTHTLKSLLK